jgi:hypothetical protein
VELQLHRRGVLEVVYLDSAVGYSCGSQRVSAGIVNQGGEEYHQLYGPTVHDFPFSETVTYTPTFNTSDLLSRRSDSDDIGPGAISGIAVGAAVCVLGGVFLFCCYIRKKSQTWKHDRIDDDVDDEIVFSVDMGKSAPVVSLQATVINIHEQQEVAHTVA